MPSPLDQVLLAVRESLEARSKAALERAEAIKKAADLYAEAVERESLSELAKKFGAASVVAADGPTAGDAARMLRALVTDLPELGDVAKVVAKPKAPPPVARPAAQKADVARDTPRRVAPRPPRPEDEPDSDATLANVPLLREAARRGRVVVIGGLARRAKLEHLKSLLGFEPDWIETDRPGQQAIRKLEGRILDGNVAAVVVIEGFIGHSQFEPVVRATRQTGTLLVYGDKAGKAALDRAVHEVESRLAKRR